MYEGFLSDEECDHLISLVNSSTLIHDLVTYDEGRHSGRVEKSMQARGRLGKSMVVGQIEIKPTSGKIRASSGMFLPRGEVDYSIIRRKKKTDPY